MDSNVSGGYVEFDSPTYSINEDGGRALVNVTRNGSSSGTLTVKMSTSNGTASSNLNYTAVVTNLLWNSGDVSPRTIAIPVFDDGIVPVSSL